MTKNGLLEISSPWRLSKSRYKWILPFMATELQQLSWSRYGSHMKGTWWCLEKLKRLVEDAAGSVCTCASVRISNPVSAILSSTQCLNATLCFHSYLASRGSLGALRWSAVSPVLREQGSRHFPISKPAAVREHMSNNWMTQITSAEAGRSSEELQLDSGLASVRPKHNSQEYNVKHLEEKIKEDFGGYGSML